MNLILGSFGWGPTQVGRIARNHGSQSDQSFVSVSVCLQPPVGLNEMFGNVAAPIFVLFFEIQLAR